MGAYRAAVVTAGGENLIAQALADNIALEFTSAKTSSYAYPSGTNIAALTGLQDVEQSAIPSASQVINDNVAQISVRFDNNEVTQTYLIQTIGLYAKVGNGSETLFSVIRAITPDEMPMQSDTSPSAFIYNIQHTIQNASQITIVVNPAGTATVQDILNIENPTFDDSGEVEGISSFPDFLTSVVSKMNLFQFFRNLKAGLQFVLHAGQIVNNCMSDATNLPLAAAQGKALMDLYTKLNSDLEGILLWENPNTAAKFDGIIVSLGDDTYKTVKILYLLEATNTPETSALREITVHNGYSSPCYMIGFPSEASIYFVIRNAYYINDVINFSRAIYRNENSQVSSAKNELLIPYQIYGYAKIW